MGWKANFILLSERGDAVFANFPSHKPLQARQVLAKLGLENYFSDGVATLEETAYLSDGRIGVGSYDGGLIFCGAEIDYPEKESAQRLVETLIRIYPSATIIEIGMHSVVNFFHYHIWRAGQSVRHYTGSSDESVAVESGSPLSVEIPFFENSELRNGERIFFIERNGCRHEYSADQMGETLAFTVAGILLGKPFDHYEIENLQVELFSPPKKTSASSRRTKPWWQFWK